jgi:hypothetical protein
MSWAGVIGIVFATGGARAALFPFLFQFFFLTERPNAVFADGADSRATKTRSLTSANYIAPVSAEKMGRRYRGKIGRWRLRNRQRKERPAVNVLALSGDE